MIRAFFLLGTALAVGTSAMAQEQPHAAHTMPAPQSPQEQSAHDMSSMDAEETASHDADKDSAQSGEMSAMDHAAMGHATMAMDAAIPETAPPPEAYENPGFAADAFVQSPLTLDYRAAGMFLNAMTPDLMPIQGTDLGVALGTALEALEQGAREARALVLVTDAEDHEDDFGDILSDLRAIDVYIVVIGTNEGAPIPVYDDRGVQQGFLRDEDGSVVTTRVGEGALQSLADQAGATIVRASADGTALDQLVDRIASGEGDEFDAREVTQFEEQYQLFLALALLLLLSEALLSDRRSEEHEWVGRFE